jgi:glyoxylase I family protein
MIIGNVHAGISVKDLDVSIRFYKDVLGLKLTKLEPVKKSRGDRLGVPGAVIKIAIFEYGTGQSLELIQYLEPEAKTSYAAPVNEPGQVHIAFLVDDIEAQIKHMESQGVEFIGGSQYENITEGPLKGWKWIYFKDPNGTNLELIEESK